MTLDEEKKKLLGEFKNRWVPIKKHYGNPPKDCTEEIAAFINQTLDEYAQAVREEIKEELNKAWVEAEPYPNEVHAAIAFATGRLFMDTLDSLTASSGEEQEKKK